MTTNAKSNADRQAAFKARRLAEGWARTTVWVKTADFVTGRQAALSRDDPADMPDGVDRASWGLGYAEGARILRGWKNRRS